MYGLTLRVAMCDDAMAGVGFRGELVCQTFKVTLCSLVFAWVQVDLVHMYSSSDFLGHQLSYPILHHVMVNWINYFSCECCKWCCR